GNTPVSSPSFWVAVSAGVAINNGQGFLGTDVGRLVRLFSEPALWNATTAYVAGNLVAYNPTGQPGAATYWTALGSSTGKIPGNDTTNWTLTPGNAANWTWGQITSLGNQISQTLAGSVNVGTMTSGGGVGAAFDGIIVQAAAASAEQLNSQFFAASFSFIYSLSIDGYVGKNYTGASAQRIAQATAYPSSNLGFVNASGAFTSFSTLSLTINLRAKASAPASASDGTLLGSTGPLS